MSNNPTTTTSAGVDYDRLAQRVLTLVDRYGLIELRRRLGIRDDVEIVHKALQVLMRLTSGDGDIFTRREADTNSVCYRQYHQPEAIERLFDYTPGDKGDIRDV